MITYLILLAACIALLLKLITLIERAKHQADNQELRKHVIRMEGRR